MRQMFLVLAILIMGFSRTNAQNEYYFLKWKAKNQIEASQITLLMDTTSSHEGKEFNERLASKLAEKLSVLGITTSYAFMGDQIDKTELIIEFDMIKPAYVKLKTFGNHIPLCNRFSIKQINKIPQQAKNKIETILAISVDKEEIGIEQVTSALAGLIYASVKK